MTPQSGNAHGSSFHLKSKNTLREKAKKHYTEERKEMEHEYQMAEEGILKAMNDCYEFGEMKRQHHRYILEFFNRTNKAKKTFILAYEENYMKLKHLWKIDQE